MFYDTAWPLWDLQARLWSWRYQWRVAALLACTHTEVWHEPVWSLWLWFLQAFTSQWFRTRNRAIGLFINNECIYDMNCTLCRSWRRQPADKIKMSPFRASVHMQLVKIDFLKSLVGRMNSWKVNPCTEAEQHSNAVALGFSTTCLWLEGGGDCVFPEPAHVFQLGPLSLKYLSIAWYPTCATFVHLNSFILGWMWSF